MSIEFLDMGDSKLYVKVSEAGCDYSDRSYPIDYYRIASVEVGECDITHFFNKEKVFDDDSIHGYINEVFYEIFEKARSK